MMCADMVTVCCHAKRRKELRVTGLLEDISPTGACLQLEQAVPVGAEIWWDGPKQKFAGRVQYCAFREIGYFVGVAFETGVRWSKKDYKPQHLLDLKKLIGSVGK